MQIHYDIYYLASFFFGSFIITYFIKFYISKFYFLTEDLNSDSRKIHSVRVVRVGSASIILLSLILFKIEDELIINIILFSYLCFFIGLIEDITLSFSYLIRLFFILFFIIFFVIQNNFVLDSFDNIILNNLLLKNNILLFLFSILGLLIIINGFNFIDGLNGLLFGNTILILLVYFFSSYSHNDEIALICISTICIVIPIAIFNLKFGNILAGDSGAYFFGALIGALSILIAKYDILDAFEIAFFIAYPVIELIFTGFRRIFKSKNPFKPDGLHLHQLLHKSYTNYMKNKKIKMSDNSLNNISSLTILIIISSLFLVQYFLNELIRLEFFLFIIIGIYFFSYYLLDKNLFKRNTYFIK